MRDRRPENARRSGPAGPDGFTMVELLVALMLLGVGVLGTVQVFAVANRHTAHAREETLAACLAEEIREKVMSESYEHIQSIFNGIDTDYPETIPTPAADWAERLTETLGPNGRGRVTVTTANTDTTLAQGMQGVRVTISWVEREQTVELPLAFTVAKIGP